MHPELFRIGNFVITSFGLMLGLSFLAAGWVGSLEFERKGFHRDVSWSLVLGALIGGIVGAKLYYAFLNFPELARDPLGTILSRAGLVWYGGLIGGAIGATYMVRRERLPFGQAADVAAVSLPVAYAIGRIGCFLVGDDYGKPTNSWIGLAFPQGQPPTTAGNLRRFFGVHVPASVPDSTVLHVYPTQLFEVGLSALIFLALWRMRRHPHRAGWLFAVYLVLAGLERGFIEFFRAKDDRFFGPFTLAQLISVVLIVAGLLGMLTLWRRTQEAPASSTTS